MNVKVTKIKTEFVFVQFNLRKAQYFINRTSRQWKVVHNPKRRVKKRAIMLLYLVLLELERKQQCLRACTLNTLTGGSVNGRHTNSELHAVLTDEGNINKHKRNLNPETQEP